MVDVADKLSTLPSKESTWSNSQFHQQPSTEPYSLIQGMLSDLQLEELYPIFTTNAIRVTVKLHNLFYILVDIIPPCLRSYI